MTMSRYYVKVFVDDSNEIEWEDLTPDKINHIEFKGKWFDEVRHGKWIDDKVAFYRVCSECGAVVRQNTNEVYLLECMETVGALNYCPNCGARMVE